MRLSVFRTSLLIRRTLYKSSLLQLAVTSRVFVIFLHLGLVVVVPLYGVLVLVVFGLTKRFINIGRVLDT